MRRDGTIRLHVLAFPVWVSLGTPKSPTVGSGMIRSFIFRLFIAALHLRSLARKHIGEPAKPRKVDSVFA
jgi:hypothetical protein